MKSATYPLAIPEGLLEELRETSRSTGVSVADAMRQSMRLGLPQLRRYLARPKNRHRAVRPFTKVEAREAFRPDREWEKLERTMSRRPVRRREGD
ncbi:MAG: hypothetical protein KGS61_05615 [Verrucomicrobia bacterium]|nr:hypothetical protein [Verrucomicrobiota bacterium]